MTTNSDISRRAQSALIITADSGPDGESFVRRRMGFNALYDAFVGHTERACLIAAILCTSRLARLTIIFAALMASPLVVLSYEIGPLKKVHETLSLMASDCLRRSPREAGPSKCLASPAAAMGDKALQKALQNAHLDLGEVGLGVVYAGELSEAVKWPDDPTSEVAGPSIVKFGLKMLFLCEKYYSGDVNGGLLCSSHFGSLQFWHAMASSSEEPTAETQRKMLAWAEFLYKVAAADDLRLDADYCDYWRGQRKVEGRGELALALAPDGYLACTGRDESWTISTLFSLTCKNPFSSEDCNESSEQRVARVKALGALLHMVQDSYAQGHAGRGSRSICATEPKRITSKFECLPIYQFYTYGEQDARRHGRADAPPKPGYFCAGASDAVDDPVLASAKSLWFVQQRKGAAALTEYLKERVFPLASSHEPHAGGGRGFRKKPTKIKSRVVK